MKSTSSTFFSSFTSTGSSFFSAFTSGSFFSTFSLSSSSRMRRHFTWYTGPFATGRTASTKNSPLRTSSSTSFTSSSSLTSTCKQASGMWSSSCKKHSKERGMRDLNQLRSELSRRTNTLQFNASHMLRTSWTYISHVSQNRCSSPWSTRYSFSTSDRRRSFPPQQPRSRRSRAP